jgi:hypothetical protein
VSNDALSALEHELGAPPPGTLGTLNAQDLRDLAGAVHAARQRQTHELAAAGESAFGHIPRLLRGPIRKVLG